MFIGRRDDKTIYGTWTVRQWDGQEELPDDGPEVVEFLERSRAVLKPALTIEGLVGILITKGTLTVADTVVQPTA